MSLLETPSVKFVHYAIGCLLLIIGLIVLPKYSVSVKTPENTERIFDTQIGDATFYARSFHGEQTASGLKLDNQKPVAAHRSYPFGTVARVTHLENGKSVNVVVIDRGPYRRNRREGAIIDLSRSAAERLDMIREGQVQVRIDVLMWGDDNLHEKR